jgi:hypothetical protein
VHASNIYFTNSGLQQQQQQQQYISCSQQIHSLTLLDTGMHNAFQDVYCTLKVSGNQQNGLFAVKEHAQAKVARRGGEHKLS